MSDKYYDDPHWISENPKYAAGELAWLREECANVAKYMVELSAALNRIEARRFALAAHVERMNEAGGNVCETLRDQWEPDEPAPEIDAWDQVAREIPETSLARRDLLKQAEALHKACNDGLWGSDLRKLAFELEDKAGIPRMTTEAHQRESCRQAEGEQS